jgi:hypothetical protein
MNKCVFFQFSADFEAFSLIFGLFSAIFLVFFPVIFVIFVIFLFILIVIQKYGFYSFKNTDFWDKNAYLLF